ncbi:MAG: hypothetical protein OEY30_02535, partial [Candidatus Bathyarchaeota archaeon]|nr:hypothetical protein [Candidatus Bathyarchaeota archaeon]
KTTYCKKKTDAPGRTEIIPARPLSRAAEAPLSAAHEDRDVPICCRGTPTQMELARERLPLE